MYERHYLQVVEKRLKDKNSNIQVLVGPRQVGKTTMISQLLSKTELPYSFESADAKHSIGDLWIRQIWETARLKLKSSGGVEYLLVIDEIQKIDKWSEEVKLQWDFDKFHKINIRVIILGSSRLLIQKGLTESLAGRFELINIPHWSFSEMHTAFGWSVDEYLWFGGYPGSVDLIVDEKRWKNYIKDSLIETSISKDILMLTRVDKPALLKTLFEIGCEYSGQILSYNKILGQLKDAGNTTTLAHYLNLLSESRLLGGLDKFTLNLIRSKSSSPKFQVYNNALLSSQKLELFDEARNNFKLWGRVVESAVGAHLISCSSNSDLSLSYWRERDNEVDFVLKKGDKIIAIEVKSGIKSQYNGMLQFIKQNNSSRMMIVGTEGISVEEFLKINPDTLF
ncbi:MAG: ATP-binding protein [Bacteroidales bacterium]|nr:ATP-binding protein [Bacteroidales bacterium]